MSRPALWTRIRRRFEGASRRQPAITVQYVGVPEKDVDAMQSMLDVLGEQLAVTFELQRDRGELVLLQLTSDAQLSTRQIGALTGGRPAVFITRQSEAAEQLFSTAERFAMHRRVLLPQFAEIPMVRRRSGLHSMASGFSEDMLRGAVPLSSSFASEADSAHTVPPFPAEPADTAQLEVLQRVLRGMGEPTTPTLTASYGPRANIQFDFNSRLVMIDTLAQQHLRVRHELPRPSPEAPLQPDAMVRELDETIWHLGLASGHLPLIGEPLEWPEAALAASPKTNIERFTKMPRHLEMARRLLDGPATPMELRRHAHIGLTDLRSFLQACLFLNFVHWVGPPQHGRLTLPSGY